MEKNSQTVTEYVYNGKGKKIQATEESVTTTYIYSGLDVLHEENTDGTAAYIDGPTALTFKTEALACGIAFFYSTHDSGWSIDRYEKEIRKKGCSCILGEDEL